MKDFIGINTRISDDAAQANKFGFVREYHEWAGDVGYDSDNISNCPQNYVTFNPIHHGSGIFKLDNYYNALSGRVSPSLKWLAPEMRGLMKYNPDILEQKPICFNGLPGVGTNDVYNREDQAALFETSPLFRDGHREDLSGSSRYFKNYVHYTPNSSYRIEWVNELTANAYAPYLKIWIDVNGDGAFDTYDDDCNPNTPHVSEVVFGQSMATGSNPPSFFDLPAINACVFKNKVTRMRIVLNPNKGQILTGLVGYPAWSGV